MTENEKIIKRLYEDSSFPLSWADKINGALLKTEPLKVYAVNHNPPYEDREDIECSCPSCGVQIYHEHLDKDIYCENCGQLLTDWDELVDAYEK
jgi:hypothetical protein